MQVPPAWEEAWGWGYDRTQSLSLKFWVPQSDISVCVKKLCKSIKTGLSRNLHDFYLRILMYGFMTVVLFPDPTMHARKGSGDIGTNSWFCKLSNHVIICIGIRVVTWWCARPRKCSNVPRPFPSWGWDLGTRLMWPGLDSHNSHK